jgi:hypothetical protein
MKHKRLFALLLAVALCAAFATSALALSASDFSDFPNNWSSEALRAAVDNGLLIGDNHGRLNPDADLNRAEMAAIVNRAWGCYLKTSVRGFSDVSEDAWYYEDIQMAVQMGTFQGDTGGTMRPDAAITREEAMAVVARALQLDLEDAAGTSLAQFSDADSVSDWALPYVRAMVKAGYVQGDGQRLTPTDNITRAEFAQIFYNIIGEYITVNGSYTGDRTGNLLVRTDDVELHDMTIDGDLILGCGVASGQITLSNVTVTGRIVVWGGGTRAVYMNDGTDVETLIVCRVDEAVKVIFDRASTLAVYEDIDVTITDRAAAFPETEVIFYDLTDLLAAVEDLNAMVEESTLYANISADLLGLVDDTAVKCSIVNDSSTDTYVVSIVRQDNGQAIADTITLEPDRTVSGITLTQTLPFGDYPCRVTFTAYHNGVEQGQILMDTTLHIAYLWAS